MTSPSPVEVPRARLPKRPKAFLVVALDGTEMVFSNEAVAQRKADALGLEYYGLYLKSGNQADELRIKSKLRDDLITHLCSEFVSVYDCTRVWEAWSVGTMSQRDFEPLEDRVEQIADGILDLMDRALDLARQKEAGGDVG